MSVDCEFERRYDRSISILKDREYKTDIKVSSFIQEHLSWKKLFLSQSHPTSHIFIECVNQILGRIGYDPLPSSLDCSPNEVNYNQCWPTSPYEMEHYRFKYVEQEDPDWRFFYADQIERFLTKKISLPENRSQPSSAPQYPIILRYEDSSY